jgi:cytochrome c peroxidase
MKFLFSNRCRARLLAAVVMSILPIAISGTARSGDLKPGNPHSAIAAESIKSAFRVTVSSRVNPLPLGKLHRWEALVTTQGRPVLGARISVTGTMPDQGHSLPTAPRVTRELGGGRYLIEGVKFDRQGWWQLRIVINAAGTKSVVTAKFMVGALSWADWSDDWTAEERVILRSLWIGSLPALPPDPSNAVGDSADAAELGHRLFFDTRLSANGKIACSSCHLPTRAFTDGRALAQGVGRGTRNSPTIIGAAYSPWFFWDGRRDSMWSQAMDPFEDSVEHGTTRDKVLAVVRDDPDYRRRYNGLFGPLAVAGDKKGAARAFANLGKAIAAYERAILPAPAKFDRYVEAVLKNREPAAKDQLTVAELGGLKIFISANQAQCIRCHNGPMFTDREFHNIGSQIQGADATEMGRAKGIIVALADRNNCLGRFSDAPEDACGELRFAKRQGAELMGAFKTPTLRFLPLTGPYFHAGQISNLNDVLWHYRDKPIATVGNSELQDLTMGDAEFQQIEAFLGTLNGPIKAPAHFLKPPG